VLLAARSVDLLPHNGQLSGRRDEFEGRQPE
jgi:hypothetical protein